jgi:hypothetical protein
VTDLDQDIGFDVLFVLDATHAFDSGGLSADDVRSGRAATARPRPASTTATMR